MNSKLACGGRNTINTTLMTGKNYRKIRKTVTTHRIFSNTDYKHGLQPLMTMTKQYCSFLCWPTVPNKYGSRLDSKQVPGNPELILRFWIPILVCSEPSIETKSGKETITVLDVKALCALKSPNSDTRNEAKITPKSLFGLVRREKSKTFDFPMEKIIQVIFYNYRDLHLKSFIFPCTEFRHSPPISAQ